jgi:RNA polymerase sigma factor (sigma-70 family)
MVNGQLDPILRHIRALIGVREADEEDARLLERFATGREEAAFAALVQRYGRLVFGVCRRVLRHAQDAEDAFQATFLVLADKAASVRKREALAAWLYGVAYRVAVKARADAARRRRQERQAPAMPTTEPCADLMARELAQVLDEELSGLPERYRSPVVLCCLAGKTQEQAARELGWPPGSMSRWLTRGKEMLRRRLLRRGVALSAPLLGTALAGLSAEAAPALPLAAATTKAAAGWVAGRAAGLVSARVAALTEGVVRTMVVTKMSLTKVLLLLVGLTATGAGVLAYQKSGPGDGPPPQTGAGLPGSGNVASEVAGAGGEGPPPGVGVGAPPMAGLGGAPDEARVPKPEFVKAEITILMDESGKRKAPPVELTLTDAQQIAILAGYFPEMGQGKKGDPAGAWKPGILIRFHRAKGDPLKVNVHWEGDVWSEGNGDWDVTVAGNYGGGVWSFLNGAIKAAELKALEGTWKAVSVEEDGKKWPDEEIKDFRWTVRGDRITFWKSGRRFVRGVVLDQQPRAFDLYLDAKEVSALPGGGEGGGMAPMGGRGLGPGGMGGMGRRGGGKFGGITPGGMMPGMGGPPGMGMGGMPGGPGAGGGWTGVFYPCIYSLEGDELKICEGHGGKRPTDFTAGKGSERVLYVLKREREVNLRGAGQEMRKEQSGDWSKPVNGLSGRLLVAFEDLKPGLRHAVTLELKNVSTKPLAVLNEPKVEVSLTDAAGVVLPPSLPRVMSGPIPDPQWGVLPRDAYMGFRVDMTTVGVPTKDHALLAVQGRTWDLKPGSYTVRAKVAAAGAPTHNDAWGGELELPPVEVVVTKEQVTPKD